VHRSTTLTLSDITVVQGVPCTTFPRTLLDIAEVIRPNQLERAFEQAEQLEVLDFGSLADQIERNRTRRGAKRLRTVMEDYTAGHGVPWTKIETDLKALVTAAGLPLPEMNRFIVLDDGEPAIRPDFYWPAHRVVVQADGWKFHRSRAAFERDRRNDQRLLAAGYRVIRITYRQIHTEPERIAAMIRTVLGL
jgi:hypothetical protein